MKKLIALLICLALPCMAQQRIVVSDGTNFWYYTGTGTTNSTTNRMFFVSIPTNYLYYLNTTNYVHVSADAANYYFTRMSNGVANIKTNSLYP